VSIRIGIANVLAGIFWPAVDAQWWILNGLGLSERQPLDKACSLPLKRGRVGVGFFLEGRSKEIPTRRGAAKFTLAA
jgi:hypothetical protein